MRFVRLLLLSASAFLSVSSGQAQEGARGLREITGYVLERSTDEPLVGASVYVPATSEGSATSAYGRFVLTTRASDSTRVLVSFVGYRPLALSVRELAVLAPDARGEVRVRLDRDSLGLGEVAVSSRRSAALVGGIPAIQMAEAERLPSILGEVDPVRVQQLLPGVSGGVEGTSGLHVRGGSPDQTLLLLDGATVYNASHLFGFFSTFNPAAVKSVDLIRGGVPARYGGRLASVLDVRTREGGGRRTSGEASVGLASAHARVEGPIGAAGEGSRTAYAVTARATYAGLIARAFQSRDEWADYGFGDANAKVSFSPTSRDRLYLSVYGGRDAFDTFTSMSGFTERGRLAWGNLTGTLRWTRPVGRAAFVEGAVIASRYALAVSTESRDPALRDPSITSYRSGLADLGVQFSVEAPLRAGPARLFRVGVEAARRQYRLGEGVAQGPNTPPVETRATPLSAWEGAAYAEVEVHPVPALQTTVGVRTSAFVSGETFASVEPRLAARLRAASGLSLTASLSGGVQYVHLLANSGLGLPTDLWLPSTDRVSPERGLSATVGAEFSRRRWTASAEVYGRRMDGLIDYRDGAGFFNTAAGDWESQVAQGEGRAYGLEALLRYDGDRTTGWVGYTLARSERQFDALNDGEWFPYRYDRTHDVAAVLVRRVGRVDLSATWVYATGDALTLPIGRGPAFEVVPGGFGYGADDPSDEIEVYSGRGAFRAPAMHRLDLSATFNRTVGKTERALTLGLYNAYNRSNPLYLALRREYEFVAVEGGSGEVTRVPRGARLYKFGFLPTLPALSYRVRF